MTEDERNQVLKAGLLLAILEGWTPISTITRKFGWPSARPVVWLLSHGYAQQGAGGVVRWNTPVEFEQLWSELIPERPCPMRLRAQVGVVHGT